MCESIVFTVIAILDVEDMFLGMEDNDEDNDFDIISVFSFIV